MQTKTWTDEAPVFCAHDKVEKIEDGEEITTKEYQVLLEPDE